eukprot:760363-Hanusia_phi.AAC.2
MCLYTEKTIGDEISCHDVRLQEDGSGDSPHKKKQSRSWDPLAANSKVDASSLDRSVDKPEDAYEEDEEEKKAYIGTGSVQVADVENWEVGSDDEDVKLFCPAKIARERARASFPTSRLGVERRRGKEREVPDAEEKQGNRLCSAAACCLLLAAAAAACCCCCCLLLLLLTRSSRILEKEDLEPVLQQFKEMLVEKNVAVECAEKLCASVANGLEGKQVSGYNAVKNAVKTAMEDGLMRILTPKQTICRCVCWCERSWQIDFSLQGLLLAQVTEAQGEEVVMGREGVTRDAQVLLAACDTFRSGAVEQLKTHAARLERPQVPVFEKGYNKDAASIAMDAVKYAGQ